MPRGACERGHLSRAGVPRERGVANAVDRMDDPGSQAKFGLTHRGIVAYLERIPVTGLPGSACAGRARLDSTNASDPSLLLIQ